MMISYLNLFTFCFGTFVTVATIKRFLRGTYSILHILVLVFYIMQIVPIVVDEYNNMDVYKYLSPFLYKARIDETVALTYDLFCAITVFVLKIMGDINARYTNIFVFDGWSKYRTPILFVSYLALFLPLLGCLLAPKPSIYLQFSYFYMHKISMINPLRIYHTTVLGIFDMIAFLALIVIYYFKQNKTTNIIIALAIFLLVWIDGKRALFVFLLIGILAIDYFKVSSGQLNSFIKKSCFLLVVIVSYFLLYSYVTNKISNDEFTTYSEYFARSGQVKLAIYNRLHGNKMLEYDGQSLLYNLLFYVPRSYWPDKPFGFYNYYTAYAFSGIGTPFIKGFNYQVNLWSEFLANNGVLGYFMALLFVWKISESIDFTSDVVTKMLGSIFILLYFMFGFELILRVLFIIYLVKVISNRVRI